MATVTIRNLDDKVLKQLKARAKTNHRSLEADLRELLTSTVSHEEKMRRFLAEADRIAAMTPRRLQIDSTDLIREDRER